MWRDTKTVEQKVPLRSGAFWRKIQRMKETWKMWQLLCFLDRNQHLIADWDYKEGLKSDQPNLPPTPPFLEKLAAIAMQVRDPRILRPGLAMAFGNYLYWKQHAGKNKTVPVVGADGKFDERLGDCAVDAQLRIGSCIGAGFLNIDEEDKTKIYLTLKGKKFVTHLGLVKEWVIEDIGTLWTAIGAVFATVGLIKWKWVVYATGLLSPWW